MPWHFFKNLPKLKNPKKISPTRRILLTITRHRDFHLLTQVMRQRSCHVSARTLSSYPEGIKPQSPGGSQANSYCRGLFMAKGFNGVQESGAPGGVPTKEDPNADGHKERQEDGGDVDLHG
jgi:hypothetical protein